MFALDAKNPGTNPGLLQIKQGDCLNSQSVLLFFLISGFVLMHVVQNMFTICCISKTIFSLTLPRFKPWDSFYGIPWFCNTPPTNFHLLRSAKGIPTAEAVYTPVATNSRSCSCHCPYVLSFRMEPLPMSSGISFHTRSATCKPCDCALAAAR